MEIEIVTEGLANSSIPSEILLVTFNFNAERNDFFKVDRYSDLTKYLGDTIHLVKEDNELLGFFITPTNPLNKEVSLKIFKYNVREDKEDLLLLLALDEVLERLEEGERLEFVLWKESQIELVRNLLPSAQFHTVTPFYHICYYEEGYAD